ncbi:endo-1,4-beta-xylanase [Streptomyces althioticus]|jgi:endo-1,4-beta-xylanase|uniref:Beta-xylanase n=1 Tax=Streptomyces griseorubens TaxID=66897 RepID=A0ABR4SZC9_9ACTN|nr:MULTISPECIES: endo-1,4-beta-xylanase [Actinomycetes]ALV51700.1 1,4-beta-xylanase [Streptomyces sp. 4F]MCC9687703.1 endo-1,4-beta-xylanase [Streptomyces sp. MNU103]GGQ67784.1 beta-xylanase [Streptomyces althioticus]GGT32472.1 beta-xylanase [Streptomyces matensis]KEG40554.1 1,4-beta-xylanase [Streptomyces griseorubens]
MRPFRFATVALATAALALPLLGGSASAASPAGPKAPPHAHGSHAPLRAAAPEGFVIGTAVAGGGHHLEQDYPDPFTYDKEYRKVLGREFSSVSPENQMKWDYIHPERDRYDFKQADAIVEFARKNHQVVRGHTLLWHSQNPAWLEEGDFTKAELRGILREHITKVVGRYKGKIQQWDVANEIFDDQGNLRTQENIWIRELGPEIVADAFRWAHKADPKAKLFFNDFNVESVNAKSDAYYALVKDLLKQRVPVHGFSVQGHLSTRYGFPGDLADNLHRFDALGLETAVTELDVRMDVPEGSLPTPAQEKQQAEYYQRMLEACLDVEGCNSFTIWGFTDKYSWVPVFFEGEGFATVMTEDFDRKPAYYALRDTLKDARHHDCGKGGPKGPKGPKHKH